MEEAMTTEGKSRCLDAFVVALSQACEGGEKRWYTSTKALQLASLELCKVCRSLPTIIVRVDDRTPRSTWSPREAQQARESPPTTSDVCISSRVPIVRALCLTWALPMTMLLESAAVELWEKSESLRVIHRKRSDPVGSLASVVWPKGLKELVFKAIFGKPVEDARWPASLRKLHFGDYFDQPIARVVWPESLQRLGLGHSFNQPIDKVVWPASLQELSFGDSFDQPTDGVAWPASLQELSFGDRFDQPIDGVAWPSSLQQLSFGVRFSKPINGVVWPASLRKLYVGEFFDQPITDIVWPASLQLVACKGGKVLYCNSHERTMVYLRHYTQAHVTIHARDAVGVVLFEVVHSIQM